MDMGLTSTTEELIEMAAFGERHGDVGSIAVPAFRHTGDLAAALKLGFPTQRIGVDDVERLGPVVKAAADRASHALGQPCPGPAQSLAPPAPRNPCKVKRA
ncbi:hypothetical protein [Arthrobacter sp. CAN_A1]|uniref:hypothetical protein n=1 Tax=Arthrobacter sp. CAN_A1 TaxID=2787717 RepID=UPI001A2CC634